MKRDWAFYEDPEDCAFTIGTRPYRIQVGMAQTRDGDPGVVIWTETDGHFGPPAFLPSAFIGGVVSEAVMAGQVGRWLREHTPDRTAVPA